MQPKSAEVMVAGAGPVGLFTAILLAEAGVETTVVDRENRTAARSYACALHPRTLELLDGLGMAEALVAKGRKLPMVAFYEGGQRRAEVDLSRLGGKFPYLLVVPQSDLEAALEERYRLRTGQGVLWNHRLDRFEQGGDEIDVVIEELEGTTTGYIVPHWELNVIRETPYRCNYLVGADGANSLVRRRLDLGLVAVARPQFFAAFEFEPETEPPNELRVAMGASDISVLWPLPGNRCRWTFQMPPADPQQEFPEKERRSVHLASRQLDEETRQFVLKVAAERAPWFSSGIKATTWCTRVVFEPRHADRFGNGNCTLVGDAAHQTGPVGAQSMNAGFLEAVELTGLLKGLLVGTAPVDSLTAYWEGQKGLWRKLLGATGGLVSTGRASDWVAKNSNRILPCLPGTGAHLDQLAAQLSLQFPSGGKTGSGTI